WAAATAVPTRTGETEAGGVRGRAPASQRCRVPGRLRRPRPTSAGLLLGVGLRPPPAVSGEHTVVAAALGSRGVVTLRAITLTKYGSRRWRRTTRPRRWRSCSRRPRPPGRRPP